MIRAICYFIITILIVGCSAITKPTRQSYRKYSQERKYPVLYAEAFDDSLDYRISFNHLDSLTLHIWELKRHHKRPLTYYFATVTSYNDTLLLNFKEGNFPASISDRLIIDTEKKTIFCINKRTSQLLFINIKENFNSEVIFVSKETTNR